MATPRPPIHATIYGDPGGGKSTMARTFPKPMLVFHFDPFGKDTPYRMLGTSTASTDARGTPIIEVAGPKDTTAVRIEYYHDPMPEKPTAYERFSKRLLTLHEETCRTVVLDSVTFMEIAARKWYQYKLNPNTREPRQWWASATDALEETLMLRFGALQTANVVVSAC